MHVLAQVPDPAPDGSLPGGALITQVLGWLKYAAIAAAVAGLLIGGVATGVGHFGSTYSASSAGPEVGPRRDRRGDARRAGAHDRHRPSTTRPDHAARRPCIALAAVARRRRDRSASGRRARTTRRQRTETAPPSTTAARDRRRSSPATVDESRRPARLAARRRRRASAAAVAAVRLTGEIARAGFITRSDMIASLATDALRADAGDESSNQLAEMTADARRRRRSHRVTWCGPSCRSPPASSAPTDHAAQVEVWSVLVVGVADVGAPRQAWRTVTVELVWEAGDWRVDGWTPQPGPTPVLAATAGDRDHGARSARSSPGRRREVGDVRLGDRRAGRAVRVRRRRRRRRRSAGRGTR